MKKYKNLKTGLVEIVTNEKVIKEYDKYTDIYKEIKASNNKKADDKPVENENDKPAE